MNTHAEILKELQTFRGGEFVPRDGSGTLQWDDGDGDGGFFSWLFDGNAADSCSQSTAHVHIREAAWKAVRAHFVAVHIKRTDDGSTRFNTFDDSTTGMLRPWTGPDDATALLAAMKHINGGGA